MLGNITSKISIYLQNIPNKNKKYYSIRKTNNQMKKKQTDRIKVLVEKLKKSDNEHPFALVILDYNSDEFFETNYSISKWFQKLSNSKSTTSKLTNREWFKNIESGFYKYSITQEKTQIILAFSSYKPILELDLKVRIQKIKPTPINMVIGIEDWELFNQYFTTLFDIRTGTETFGKLKTMEYYELEKIQNIIQ